MIPRIILLVTLALLALDALFFAWALNAWILSVLAPLFLGAFFFLLRRWFAVREPVHHEGLSLGAGIDITDPDRPTRIGNAVIPFDVLNLGALVLGSPGAGKTVMTISSLQAYAQQLDCGWAMFEGKGDTDIYKKAVACGAVPDHFFSSELPGSGTINLMAGEPFDVIDRLSRILIGKTSSTTFFADEQRTALSRVVPVLMGLGKPVNLADLYVMLDSYRAATDVIRLAKRAGVAEDKIMLCEKWYTETEEDKRKELLKGLLNKLYVFVASPNAPRLNAYQPSIDIHQCVSEGKKVYWHFPLSEFARDVAVAVIEMYSVEARRRQQAGAEGAPYHPQFFDDWGAFFHDGFGPYSARCRSVNMPLFFSFQSRAQLQEVSMTFADILDDTTATKFIMRVQGAASARYSKELLGEYERLEVGVSQLGERNGQSLQFREVSRVSGQQLREQDGGGAFVSTLAQDAAGSTYNALWAVRVPMPDYAGWEEVPMPAEQDHSMGDGLDLWGTYMTPFKRRQMEREAVDRSTGEIVTHDPGTDGDSVMEL